MTTVPSGDIAIASVSTRRGPAVAARIERLKSETKEWAKKSSVRRANLPTKGRGVSKIWHVGADLPHGAHTEVFSSQPKFSGPCRNLQAGACEILKHYQASARARSVQAFETKGLFFSDPRGALETPEPPDPGPVAPRHTNIREIAKTFFIGLAIGEKFAAKFGWGGGR
jgi:hypothetical protein